MLGYYKPFLAFVSPAFSEFWDSGFRAVNVVGNVDFVSRGVYCADEGVLGDVGEVALVFKPRACGGDSVCRALSFYFIENAKGCEFRVGEGREGIEEC